MPTLTHSTQRPAEGDPDAEYGCAFVLRGGDGPPGGAFCEAPRRPGSAYCPQHHALCHLPSDSVAERQRLREIEALAEAVGGKRGRPTRTPPPRLLRRLDRIARAASSPDRSCFVRNDDGACDAARRTTV